MGIPVIACDTFIHLVLNRRTILLGARCSVLGAPVVVKCMEDAYGGDSIWRWANSWKRLGRLGRTALAVSIRLRSTACCISEFISMHLFTTRCTRGIGGGRLVWFSAPCYRNCQYIRQSYSSSFFQYQLRINFKLKNKSIYFYIKNKKRRALRWETVVSDIDSFNAKLNFLK